MYTSVMPYSQGLIWDNTSNYGIVKTETLIGFAPANKKVYNHSIPMEWIFTRPAKFERRSLDDENRALKIDTELPKNKAPIINNNKIETIKNAKKIKRKSKSKKCVFKVFRKGDKKLKRQGANKMHKKYFIPMLLGLFAAKSLLIPIALKALAFLSTKGIMLGFLSTVMASVLSLKGALDNGHRYHDRKDDTKTQVEIIHVPTKSEDHVYYDEHYNKRGDFIPIYDKNLNY